jgi:hypothetical protein
MAGGRCIRHAILAPGLLLAAGVCAAEPIDVEWLRGAWARAPAREFEVGRHPVQWRQQVGTDGGVLAGLEFAAPCGREALWRQLADAPALGRHLPGVRAVAVTPQGPDRRLIEVTMRVLWKELRLRFEVEQQRLGAEDEVRVRLSHEALGEFLGLCALRDGSGEARSSTVRFVSLLRPGRPVPSGVILWAQRAALVRGARNFLASAERSCYTTAPGSGG